MAPQPPARFGGRVRAQAVADEVHVLEAVAQLGLRKDGASGPPGRGGERVAGMDPGGTTPALRPPRTTRSCAPEVTFPESRGLLGARANSADQRPPGQLQAALAGTGVRSPLPPAPIAGLPPLVPGRAWA